MSVTIAYKPVTSGKGLPGQSKLKEQIERVFGTLPIVLNNGDVNALEILEKVWVGDNPYTMLITAIEEYGAVRIEAEY